MLRDDTGDGGMRSILRFFPRPYLLGVDLFRRQKAVEDRIVSGVSGNS
jgi:hypothetical protein